MDKSDWVNPFPNVTMRRREPPAWNNLNHNTRPVNNTSSSAGRVEHHPQFKSNIPPDNPPDQEDKVGGSKDGGDGHGESWLFPLILIGLVVSVVSFNLILPIYSYYVNTRDDCKLSLKEIKQRMDGLVYESRSQLFGQHLAVDGGLSAIYAHLSDPQPAKPLVLSFHGSLGSGKTFFSHIIAKNLFEGGLRSVHVKAFLGPRHFILDPTTTQRAKEKLLGLVEEGMMSCGRSLFIFDEADKMPLSTLDALSPFLGHQGILDGVDYRRGIFIFISNTGAQQINNVTLQALRGGVRRESLRRADFKQVFSPDQNKQTSEGRDGVESEEGVPPSGWSHGLSQAVHSIWERLWSPLLFLSSCNCTIPGNTPSDVGQRSWTDPGGFFESEMTVRGLVDHYLPFLPLQREHVILCIKRELSRRNIPQKISPAKILESMDSFPSWGVGGEMFAKEGCKNVGPHVSRYLNQGDHDLFFNNQNTQLLTT